jgi:hypothetical protein
MLRALTILTVAMVVSFISGCSSCGRDNCGSGCSAYSAGYAMEPSVVYGDPAFAQPQLPAGPMAPR